jgi:hypothetical protein
MTLAPASRDPIAAAIANNAAANDLLRHINAFGPIGNVFYVHYTRGTNGAGAGVDPETPFKTIDYAIAFCRANRGDLIIVLPGHAETVTGDIDVDVAGISIVGLGVGETRPVVTFGTSTAAKLDIDAANCLVRNIVCKNDIDSQVVVIDIDGAGTVVEDCEILEGSSKQFLIGIDVGADRCALRRNQIISVAVGANSGIKISAAVARPVIEDNFVYGDFADAALHNPTSAVATLLQVRRNSFTNLQSGDHAIELVSACTGVIEHNMANSSLAAAGTAGAIDGGSCFMNQNYGVDATADVQGILNPAADS